MKQLFLLFMFFIPLLSNAQLIKNLKTDQKVELKESVEKYCVVVLQAIKGKIGFYAGLDELGAWEFIDSNGNPIEMKTNVAVMNFMYKNGWEYINNIGGSDAAAPQYFFKKRD